MTWLAVWDCNLIVQVGVVILNIPMKGLEIGYLLTYEFFFKLTKHGRVMTRFVKNHKNGKTPLSYHALTNFAHKLNSSELNEHMITSFYRTNPTTNSVCAKYSILSFHFQNQHS